MDETRVTADAFVLGANNVSTGYAPGVPPPAPHASRRAGRARLIAGAAAFIVGAVGGFLGWRALFGAFPFPDQIAGAERVESEFVNSMVEMIQTSAEQTGGLKIDVAVYGDGFHPQYVMFVAEIKDPAALSQLADPGLAQTLPFVDLSGEDVGCVPNPEGAACAWVRGDDMVGLGGVGTSPDQLRAIAVELKAELD